MHAEFQQLQGLRIRHLVQGEGAPVLLVHGWGAHIELLQPLAQRLSHRGYRCFMLDLPGFGQSQEPQQAYSIFDYAQLCLAYMDALGLESAHFFGHSMGGRIGLILGSAHARRIRSMALSNSAGIRQPTPTAQKLRLSAARTLRRSLSALGAPSLSQRLHAAYNKRYGSSDFQQASPVMRQTLIQVVNQDLLACAATVAVPTVLLWGDADRDTPLWTGRKLEAAIPDAALIVHAGAGHYAYLDFPDKSAAIIDALFRRH